MPQSNTPAGNTTTQTPPAPNEPEETKAAATTTKRSKAIPPAPTHYKVTSGGLTGAGGVAYYRDAILTLDQIGDEARIAKLLSKGAIAPVEPEDDAADA